MLMNKSRTCAMMRALLRVVRVERICIIAQISLGLSRHDIAHYLAHAFWHRKKS